MAKSDIPSSIPEYFVRSPQSSNSIHYRPFIAGFSKLHFVDKKNNVDAWINSFLVVEPDQEGKVSWEAAESHPDLKDQIVDKPAENATYQEVPPPVLQEKNYPIYERSLSAYLYQNHTLKIFEFKELKLISSAEESESDFRQRVSLGLREQRDEQVQKLQEQYDKKITTLKEKILKVGEKKSVQQQQSLSQKFEAFLSMVTTVIGAFFGRRLSQTTINQAGTTFRRMGRIGKESQDVARADESLQGLQQQLQVANSQLEADIAKIPTLPDPSHLPLSEVVIRPRKTDISIEQIALVWWP